MKAQSKLTALALVLCGLLLSPGVAQAEDISGPITTTLTIFEHSRLVGDVTCAVMTGPCISFGAPGIELNLSGYKITGPLPPFGVVSCPNVMVPVDGISSNGQNFVGIRGPGLIERFRRHGIFLVNSSGVFVIGVTLSANCYSGLAMDGVTESAIQQIVSVRNALVAPFVARAGGISVSNSHDNTIRGNEYSGNGSSASPFAFEGQPGIALVGNSSGNLIVENHIGGNAGGVLLRPTTAGNVIRGNLIAGNPPVHEGFPPPAPHFDIEDQSPAAAANIFEGNHCLTYVGAAMPRPCPNLP